MWHPTYCRNHASSLCGDGELHDEVIYETDRGKVTAELFIEEKKHPIPLVVISAHSDNALTPGQARAFAQAILVAADEAEYAATEYKADTPTKPGMILGM